jgi:sialidase-1
MMISKKNQWHLEQSNYELTFVKERQHPFVAQAPCLALLVLAFLILTDTGSRGADEADKTVKSQQYGATRLDFTVGGRKGFVILPTKAAQNGSKPWIWYAPTFIGGLPDGTHTWMFKQLLDHGFAICGVDVGESYGNPAGRKSYHTFYEHVVKTYGFSPKACLLPQSRGGLMLYNWAVENPKCVQCVGEFTPCAIWRVIQGWRRQAAPTD